MFGDSIPIPPNTGIKEDLKQAFNNQIPKRNQAKRERNEKEKKIRCGRQGGVCGGLPSKY